GVTVRVSVAGATNLRCATAIKTPYATGAARAALNRCVWQVPARRFRGGRGAYCFCRVDVISTLAGLRKSIRGSAGAGGPIVVRLHEPQLSNLDAWIADQGDHPSRPEAIRRLLAQAFGAGTRRK